MVIKSYIKVILAGLIICSAFCKEEQNLTAKDNLKSNETVKVTPDPEWDSVTGVYAMDDGRTFYSKFNIKSQLKDYCLQIDVNKKEVNIGFVEGNILKGYLISLEKEKYFQFELNGQKSIYYFITGIHGGSGEKVQVLMTDDFSKRLADGNWDIDTSAGSQAAFNTMKGCVNQLKLAIELQYRENN
ncbi:hypothetical protein [Leptospira licerasiae]|uniref:hypothetical protein n=1 Tax=Leptospira licerasiae TaxID=447106 RepID=UPI00301AEF2B